MTSAPPAHVTREALDIAAGSVMPYCPVCGMSCGAEPVNPDRSGPHDLALHLVARAGRPPPGVPGLIDHINSYSFTITVAWRDVNQWAVCCRGHRCLGSDGEWDYEPSPSNRTDEWKATHRFDLNTALALAEEHAPLMTCNGWTVDQVLAKDADR